MSENNFLNDRLFEIQNDPAVLSSMKSNPYIYNVEQQMIGESVAYGSLLVQHVDKNKGKLEIATLIGFSSSDAGVEDVDYAHMSAREDYVSKFSALSSGRMLFPTQSDKKTWGYIKGLFLPGLDFNKLPDTVPSKKGRIVNDEVLDQLIAYAKTEDASITRFLSESIPDSERVQNYDESAVVEEVLPNGEKIKHTVKQGGRFSTLLGVWDNGRFIEFNKLFDENGVYQDEQMCQRIAHEYFFDKSPEEQRNMINEILLRQVEKELQYICELGIIQDVGKQNQQDSNMLRYQNVGLDYKKLDSIYGVLAAKYPNGDQDKLRRTALMMLVGDVVAKGIISMNEYERVFSGHPSFYGFKYDKNGHLYNRTDDQSKRLGGLVSTGFNNVILPGIEEDYVCAEVNDEKASEDNIDELYKLIHEGTIRDTYLKNRIAEEGISFDDVDRAEQLSKEVDEMEIEDIWNTFDDVVKTVITNSVNSKVNAFKKINVTDGASYISEQMCENLLRMAGSFNGDVKRAFDILTGKEVDGKVYTTKDIRELAKAYQLVLTSVIGAQKYTAFGFRERKHTDAEGNTTITHIPYYNKTALFPIFKSIATGPLADFYQKMQNNHIDMIMMRSAVKVGGQGSVSVDWNNIDSLKFNTYTQKIKYLRKQFNTDPKDKEEMSIGTQTKKVALSTLVPGRTYVVGGENLSATQVRNRIMECLNAMSDSGMQITKELFFTDGQFDVNKFSSVLTKELVGRGASAEMIDAVSVENGQLKVPLAALSGMNWIQSIIKSMIDKRVIDTNTPGKAFYQRSPWGMEGVSVLSDENIPPSLNDGKPLQVKNEDGSMDVVLSIDYFEDILKKAKVKTGKKIKKTRKVVKKEYDTYEKYGVPHTDYTRTHDVQVEEEYETDEYVSVSSLSFEEQRQWLIDHKIIGGPKYDEDGKPIPGTGASANIIGYRIPTQAVSSIHAMRCVDVIPVIRDTIIMPKAITSITGSDYDIDKMFLSRLYYNPQGTVDFEERTHEWYANRLINAYLSVLKDSDHSFQDLNGSIDNDTSFLTEIRDDLREGIQKETLMPYSGYILREQSNTKNVFISGKFGIAPFALNNNTHILMQLYNVKLDDSESIMTRLGLTNLGGYQDRYGKSIMSWFSGLINAHVDAAKDPWIPELNVNQYTYNLVSLLTHAGLGKDTFYFTTQPIMRQLAISYQNANGIYMNDQSKSKTKISEEAEQAVVKNMIDAHFGQAFKSYDVAIKYYQGTCDFNIDDAIQALFAKDCDVMRKVAKKHIGEFGSKYTSVEDDVEDYELTINGEKHKMSAFDIQMIVYFANTQFKPYAKALSSLVQHTKIDTKKQGKNLVEQQKYLQGVAELFEPDAQGEYRALFDTQSLDNMYQKSYIQHQTQVATNLFRQVLGNQMIEATDQFVQDVDRVLTTVGNTGKDPKVINLVQNAIMAKIKSKYFFGQNGYCERYKINPESLISGSSTIYDKLLQIKTNLINDQKYRQLIDSRTGGPINYLLQALVSGNKYEYDGGVKFIQSLDFVIDDTFNADDLTQAWEDLLSDSRYPELQQFARELIVYAFITSGDYGGKNLFKYVPNSWKLGKIDNDDNSYSEHMRNQHTQCVNGFQVISDQDIEDIVLNNWYNDSIVPKYNMYNKNKPVFQSFTSGKDVNGTPLLIAGIDNSGNSTITNPKTYIKIPKYDSQSAIKGRDAYNMYKLVSSGSSKTGSNYPIYQLVDHKGGVYDKRERVLQYYANERSNSEELVNRSLKTLLDILGVTATTPGDALLTIADYVYEHKTNLSVLVQSNIVDKTLAAMVEGVNRQRSAGASYESDQTFTQRPNYYDGNIVPDGSTIMVFGSNPQGIHGAGAARYAKDMFGAKIGVGEGMTGNAYALPTKDIEASKGTEWYRPGERQRQKVLDHYRAEQSGFEFDPSNITYDQVKSNPVKRTISPDDIVKSIKSLYEAARQTPEKVFKVAYTNGLTELTLNGYVGAEMIAMFKEAGPIPTNVHFSRAWVSTGMFDQTIQEPKVNTPGTYDMPYDGHTLHSGGANGVRPMEIWYGSSDNDPNRSNPDLSNFAERPFKIKGSVIGAPGSNEEYEFKSVERAFQAAKVFYTDMMAEERDQWFKSIQNAATSAKAKQLGGEVPKLDITDWNTYKYEILKDLIKASFEQNETARNRLLSTGNVKLTHTRGRKEYSREFPRILMEVREELRAEQNSVQEERKPRLIKKGATEYENVYQNMTDSEYEEWKKQNSVTDERSLPPSVLARMHAGRSKEVDPSVLNVVRDLDKSRRDYNRIARRSKTYVVLRKIMENMFSAADVQLPDNASQQLLSLHKQLKELQNSAEHANLMLGSRTKEPSDLYKYANIYKNYKDLHTPFVVKYIKEFYNIDAPIRDSQFYDGELYGSSYIETPIELDDRKRGESSIQGVKQQLIQQFGEGAPNAKLTELVFNALDGTGVTFESADLGEGVSGRFVASENKILYNPDALQPNTLLHESVHAVTCYYLKTANRSNLPKEIQQAITEIEYCYDLLKQDFIEQHFDKKGISSRGMNVEKAFEFWIQSDDLYGYSSPIEMIAEISKPEFLAHIRDFDRRHKGKNIFDKLISAILKLFGVQKEYKSVEKTIKDAMVTLLTNPSKELMDKYAEENRRAKENYKLFISSNTVSFVNKKVVYEQILPQLERFDEYLDSANSTADVTVNIPRDIVDYSFEAEPGKEGKLNDGQIVVFRDGPMFMSIVGNVEKLTQDQSSARITFRVYSLEAIQSTIFEIKNDEYGRPVITSSKSVYDDQKIFDDVSEPVSPFGEGRIGALHEQRWILTNRLREVVNKKQVVQKQFISPIEHDPFVINTPAGKLRGINGFIDNGKSIFGLVSMRINISENVVTSPFIFPTEHLFDNKYNFARLDNSVKSNYFTIAYNILNYLELNGFKSVESEWYRGKSEKNERVENLKKMFGNDIENLINIQEDVREEYSPVFGKVTVPFYKFVINVSKFSNLIASNHDVNVDNDVIQLVKSAISKQYDRSEEDISTGREAMEKLNASADAIRQQISELDDEIRKEQIVYLSNLGKKQEDKCNGGFEDLPF